MKKHRRGYTAVELLMALAILGISVSGVIAMQKITIVSNQHAKNMAIAMRIADGWAEALALEGSMWNWSDNDPDLANDTVWLRLVGPPDWFRPNYDARLDRGAGFNALGAPLAVTNGAAFCTDLRLMLLKDGNTGPLGLIRAEIRVFWPRENAVGVPANFCSPGAVAPGALTVEAIANNYHFVHTSTAILQQSGKPL